jgi:TolB-like protein
MSTVSVAPVQPEAAVQESIAAPTVLGKPSVAVLGFEDIGEPGVLSVGLAADLIGRLSRLAGLFVIARASSMQFRPGGTSFSEVGRKLGVRYLVQGTVQRHGKRIRLHVELVEAEQGRQVWSESYDRARDDLFLLQDELADAVVSALEPAIERAEYERASLKPPESLDAWENYHMALWHSFRFTAEDTLRANDYLKRALAEDPRFSRAHAAMSLVHFSRAFLDASADPGQDIAAALASAEQSVGLDGRDAMGHWSLGRAQFLSQQHDLALDSIDRALQVNPNYAQGHYARGFVGFHAGEDEQTLLELDTARRLSPFDPLMFAMTSSRAMTLALGGQVEEGAQLAVSATQQPNAHFHIFAIAAACLEMAGQHERAMEQMAKAKARHPGYSVEVFFRSFPHKLAARRQLLDASLRRAGLD